MKNGGIIRGWYEKNKRDLPWRRTRDPYKIWMSEVILQQTRVNQGTKYYLRFIKSFPDVTALARADEDEVLKLWQGLGYYSRARNLHQAAKSVVEQMKGEIPGSYADLLKLKGVGGYTASAIASICFREPRAVVDGNVSRVIARLYGMDEPINSTRGGKLINSLAHDLLDRNDPGTHNQAMMEFGALQCVPVSPDCEKCPLMNYCEAWATGRVNLLPVKIPKLKPVERWM
ncbi:MAG: A/G-specific adenine glycosylase, partial [Anaerolineales bacterium]|nr:A/G-specific adenine glycosylase [Anaerolineales bacterium]